MIAGLALSLLWMVILPFMTGCILLPVFKRREQDAGIAFLFAAGLMLHYAAYEVLALGGKLAGLGMRRVTVIFAVFAVISALVGAFAFFKAKSSLRLPEAAVFKDGFFIAAFILVGIQIACSIFLAVPDQDDAFYSGLSSMSVAYDYLMDYNAYFGDMTEKISARYVLSALPVYQGSLSLLAGRLHHLIIQHDLFPLFYMPLGYGLFYEAALTLIGGNEAERVHANRTTDSSKKSTGNVSRKEKGDGIKGKVLFFLALLHLFGNYYVFSPEMFLVTRLWQGKALFAAICVPFLFLVLTWQFDNRGFAGGCIRWLLVLCTVLACVFAGETGLVLAPVVIFAFALAGCIEQKRFWNMIPAALCMLPEAVMILWLLKAG